MPFPSVGDLPSTGIEPDSLVLSAEFFLPLTHQGGDEKIIMCQCKFISCNKCSTLVADVDNEETVCMFAGVGIYRKFLFPIGFCCEFKTDFKT